MRAAILKELEEMAAKLLETARKLPSGQDRHNALQEIGRFRARITALQRLDFQSPQPYDLVTRPCTIHAGRFRWDIRQNGRPVQSSIESFASEQEAHMDGRLELEKLMGLDRWLQSTEPSAGWSSSGWRRKGNEDRQHNEVAMISVLIGVLIIVVVGAICFWAIDKFATDGRLANLLKLLVVLVCLGAILQRVLPLTY
jgi:hypothetical protein